MHRKVALAIYVAIILTGLLGVFLIEILPGYLLETDLVYGRF